MEFIKQLKLLKELHPVFSDKSFRGCVPGYQHYGQKVIFVLLLVVLRCLLLNNTLKIRNQNKVVIVDEDILF